MKVLSDQTTSCHMEKTTSGHSTHAHLRAVSHNKYWGNGNSTPYAGEDWEGDMTLKTSHFLILWYGKYHIASKSKYSSLGQLSSNPHTETDAHALLTGAPQHLVFTMLTIPTEPRVSLGGPDQNYGQLGGPAVTVQHQTSFGSTARVSACASRSCHLPVNPTQLPLHLSIILGIDH